MILKTNIHNLELPAFFPDATHGCVKSVDSLNLRETKTQGLVVNAYHLFVDDVIEIIKSSGGMHNFINFKGPIITDSGGFQVMSLIRRNKLMGKLTDNGAVFNIPNKGKVIFTPEVSIESQINIGSDIVMCFDDCTEPHESPLQQAKSVNRTIEWAQRCKNHFNKLTSNITTKPLLFGIIQGGRDKRLREKCAMELCSIGFDGYAFGGWPTDDKKVLMKDILQLTASLMPDDKPKYAMGIGKPEDIFDCFEMGFNMFDCVLPTRDGRHERLYVFNKHPNDIKCSDRDFYNYIYISSSSYSDDKNPISEYCDCPTCENYTRSYLRHLFKVKEASAYTLATVHNLRFYSMLTEILRNRQ